MCKDLVMLWYSLGLQETFSNYPISLHMVNPSSSLYVQPFNFSSIFLLYYKSFFIAKIIKNTNKFVEK
jgi:hypothetical protein